MNLKAYKRKIILKRICFNLGHEKKNMRKCLAVKRLWKKYQTVAGIVAEIVANSLHQYLKDTISNSHLDYRWTPF